MKIYSEYQGTNYGFSAEVFETGDMYRLVSTTSTNTFVNEKRLDLDKDGNVLSAYDDSYGQFLYGYSLTANSDNDLVLAADNSGGLVWEQTITVFPVGVILELANLSVVRDFNGGLLLTGRVVHDISGVITFSLFTIKTDSNGNVEQQNIYNIGDFGFILNGSYVADGLGNNSNYYARLFVNNNERLIKLAPDGEILWNVALASDLPSTDVFELEVSPDGAYVFVFIRDNQRVRIPKFDTSDGTLVGNYYVGNLFSPGGSFTFEYGSELIATIDGGVVVSYNYTVPGSSETGFEYGKINEDGTADWWNTIPKTTSSDLYTLRAKLETSDGGYLFIGEDESDQVTVLKVTADGETEPQCGESGEGTDIVCNLSYTLSGGNLSIFGAGLDAPHVIVHIFDENWQTVYTCFDDCGSSIDLNNLSDGVYRISVDLYDSGWSKTCDEIENITIGSGNGLEGVSSEVLFFNAMKDGRQANLNWVVNNSYKTDYFIVERSFDGSQFEIIDQIAVSNNSEQALTYQVMDAAPRVGMNFYRMIQIFNDGTIRQSTIKPLTFDLDVNAITLFPNPTSNEFFLSLKGHIGSAATVTVYNALGQQVQSIQVDEVDETPIRFDASNLRSGIYQVSLVIDDNKMLTNKIVIAKE